VCTEQPQEARDNEEKRCIEKKNCVKTASLLDDSRKGGRDDGSHRDHSPVAAHDTRPILCACHVTSERKCPWCEDGHHKTVE